MRDNVNTSDSTACLPLLSTANLHVATMNATEECVSNSIGMTTINIPVQMPATSMDTAKGTAIPIVILLQPVDRLKETNTG